ncbi:uncharacterized protein HMPREF1541_08469 [Cyphellophora europaea CBS 101466]|uniref:Xylanolytic transcriptional activator regulatory domain-containing protein n=1 Tax=Cyphellophora europaea (strain CBS 101466) TaxID=1220924 RepID=W2RI42_CYPE1|nr:uncharacterized protein HMPREF1541_08469 [Cyphellophora europaea CBS 101466]ETN36192.1 hypothetical protein HMPREF1541_08469 [Cyphellophora europaea CBS 101466]
MHDHEDDHAGSAAPKQRAHKVAESTSGSSPQDGNQQYHHATRENVSLLGATSQQLSGNDTSNVFLSPLGVQENSHTQGQLDVLPGFPDQDTGVYDQAVLYATFDDMDFNSNLDWFMDQTSVDHCFMGADTATLPIQFVQEAPQIQFSPSGQVSTSNVAQSEFPMHAVQVGNHHRDRGDDSLGGIISPEPQENAHSVGPWPSETPAPPQHHIILPALGSEGSKPQRFPKFFALPSITDKTRNALCKCLSLPLEYNPFQSLSLDAFPSQEKLDHCVDLYFRHFHPTVPVIHQPTFDPGKDLIVTLAIISIGSCYTNLENARNFAVCLSELLGRLLSYMVQQDRRFVRTPSYLVAQVLQGTHGYCSGSERLFELSESSRGTLVHNAKCMGLFRYESKDPDLATLLPEHAWHAWIDAERLRRLGWAVYKYDGSVAYLHNVRPYLSVGDINLPLPASEEYWTAESAPSWAALHPWSRDNVERSLQLRTVIRMLFDGTPKAASKISDEEHAFIVVLTLVRMLWSLKEIKSSPIHDLVTPPIYENGGQTLLRAVQSMAVPLDALAKTHTGAEMSQFVHRMHLVHAAHLYGSGDLMNWLYPYLRHGPEAENATRRMKQWALESPQRTRDVAYHCAQIIGLLRYYPYNLPLEPFMLFHAGVVLSCVASLLPVHNEDSQNPSLQLEALDWSEGDVHDRQMAWVTSGINACPSLIGVPILCCSAGRRAVLEQTAALLKRCKSWGMARNLTKVVLSLQSRGDEPKNQNANGSMPEFSGSDMYPGAG